MQDFSAVLCVGHDIDLLNVRSAVLRTRFLTVSSGVPADVQRLLPERAFALMVLCHTLSQVQCKEAVKQFHGANPDGAVLAVCTLHTTFSLEEADVSVAALAGPQCMFDAVEGLQHRGMARFGRVLPT